MNGKLARTASRHEVSGAQIVHSINRERTPQPSQLATQALLLHHHRSSLPRA